MSLTTSLENYDSCTLWFESLKSKSTKNSYTIHLKLFCKFHKTDPDTLIQLRPEQLKHMVLNYIIHLKKSSKTISR
jgi:hypothetical protein